MILALDVGNSHIHAGVFIDQSLVLQFRYSTVSATAVSSDQIGVFMRQVLHENGYDPQAVSHVAIASVVPAINYTLRAAFIKYFGQSAFFLTPQMNYQLRMDVTTPEAVGVDRLAACIAAVDTYPGQHLIIFDLGTATVVDVVADGQRYLSGAILPGLKTSLEALSHSAAQLANVSIIKPKKAIGHDTTTNVQAGLYYSHLGALKCFKETILYELDTRADQIMTIATGGFAQLFAQDQTLFDVIMPDLVLKGIKQAFEMNYKEAN